MCSLVWDPLERESRKFSRSVSSKWVSVKASRNRCNLIRWRRECVGAIGMWKFDRARLNVVGGLDLKVV